MLSVFDLLEADTLDLDLAAYLMARISTGASFMVGASPGAAGKTTVMCALLNFVPIEVTLTAATAEAIRNATKANQAQRTCYICHEIGAGHYFAYLWGQDLVDYCSLAAHGHILATNLHADDIAEAEDQVCRINKVPREDFNRFALLIFMRIETGASRTRRWINKVYSSDGQSEHKLIFDASSNAKTPLEPENTLVSPAYLNACRNFMRDTPRDTHTIEQTRRTVEEFLQNHSNA